MDELLILTFLKKYLLIHVDYHKACVVILNVTINALKKPELITRAVNLCVSTFYNACGIHCLLMFT